jgi:hypothetical protein
MAINIPGLSETEQDQLNDMVDILTKKRTRNFLRDRYYNSKQVIQQLGIAIPPSLQMLETVVGWPHKAIQVLNRRLKLDGFVVPGQSSDAFGISEIFAMNHNEVEASQVHTSAMKYGPAFIAVTRGDEQAGEPPVLLMPRSAMYATALWDRRKREIAAALSVLNEDDSISITEFILYLPDKIVYANKSSSGSAWRVDIRRHSLGRVLVSLLAYQPDLDKPFGRSRISREVMSLTDQAVRTLLRAEISAELYSSPQRYALGVNEEAFIKPDGTQRTGWEVQIGRLLALSPNEDGTLPSVGQFPQLTMQPHMDHLRAIATLFAGATDISVSSLGIIHDQPASAEAMHAANIDLVLNAEAAQDTFGFGWLDAARMAVMIRDNITEPTGELFQMKAKWRDPATPTKTSSTQAVVSQVQAGILPPDSAVTLEQLGYDETTILRIQADSARNMAGDRLTQLVEASRALRQAQEATTSVMAPMEPLVSEGQDSEDLIEL